jgi:hypothetical protein
MSTKTKFLSLLGTGALVAASVVVPSTAATAGTACSGTSIRINVGAGGESPSWATGHAHQTGRHYVGVISGNLWYWYADNDGGSNGDTTDTYYGLRSC